MTLDDAWARHLLSTAVHRRLVAVAGAGSGKTTQLVARVAATVHGTPDAAPVPASALAVITFTDKAARELVHRLRDDRVPGIDDAYVGTIHGLCASILRSYPIEAGLPPTFSTADEITSQTDAAARVRQLLATIYDRSADDAELREALEVVATHVGLHALPSVVEVIDSRWHRFERLRLHTPPLAELERLAHVVMRACDELVDSRPNGSATLTRFCSAVEALRGHDIDVRTCAGLDLPTLGNVGGGGAAPLREAITDAQQQLRAAAHAIVIHRIVDAFRPLVVAEAKRRIANGQLDFDDLLVLTLRLLRGNHRVLAELRQRYQRVFVDEFQDTDRVQFEIISLLTAPDGQQPAAACPRLFAVGDPKQSIYGFRQAEVELFADLADEAGKDDFLAELVSNFRTRGDVAAWINTVMQRRFDRPILADRKAADLAAVGLWPPPITVPYEPLHPIRPAQPVDVPDPGPPVVLLGVDAGDATTSPAQDSDPDLDPSVAVFLDGAVPKAVVHETSAQAQAAEAADIVGLAERVLDEGWRVLTKPATTDDATGDGAGWASRPARRSDIAVLVARRTGLGELEDALRRAGIPYRVEGGTLAYDRREVYELLRVVRAVENPADELALFTALRTTILGCSDADLFAYRHRSGDRLGVWRADPAPDVPEPAPGDTSDAASVARVRRALAQIETWSREAHRRTPAALLTAIYDWSFGAAAARFEGEHTISETWRRARYLIDEARAWSDETAGTLHEYLAWVADKVESVDRSEIAPDETDEDSLRILTIHAAKGLQFPIVIVAGLGAKDNNAGGTFRVAFDAAEHGEEVAASFRFGVLKTPGFPNRDELAEWAEEARLLYVAMTRTQDHLVVSCHTSKRSTPNPAQRLVGHLAVEGAELWSSDGTALHRQPDFHPERLSQPVPPQPVTDAELPARPSKERRTIWTPSALAAQRAGAAAFEGSPGEPDDDVTDRAGTPSLVEPTVPPPAATGAAARRVATGQMSLFDQEPTTAGSPSTTAAGAVPPTDNAGRSHLDADDGSPSDPGLQRDPPLDALRTRGRYGTDIGRAVHEVMQRVELADPAAGLDALVDAACDNVDLAEPAARQRVGALARSMIASPLFARMQAAPVCEREIYVGAIADPGWVDLGVASEAITIWGYADAVFQNSAGDYVVVDFKTDSATVEPAELGERYGLQLRAYGHAIEQATGASVSELWLLVGRPDAPALEIAVPR